MKKAQLDVARSAGLPSRTWLAPELLAAGLPAALVLLAGSLICAAAWRSPGIAPLAERLCDGVSAALWVTALWLAPALDKWQTSLLPASDTGRSVLRTMAGVLAALLACVPVAVAPVAVLLAYDSTSALASARPLDIAQFDVTLPTMLWRLLIYAGPACIGLSLGLLLLLRRIAGYRSGSLLWLTVGLLLHAPLFDGPRLIYWPFTIGNWARFSLAQFSNPDLLQENQIFSPLYGWLALVWLLAFVMLALASCLRTVPRSWISPLQVGLTGALLATGLRSLELGERWSANAALLLPDSVNALLTCWSCVTAVIWAILVVQITRGWRRDLQQGWCLLPMLYGSILLCSLPVLRADAASVKQLALGLAIAIGLLGASLAIATAWLGSSLERSCKRTQVQRGLSVLTTLSCLLALFSLPVAEGTSNGLLGTQFGPGQTNSSFEVLVGSALNPELRLAATIVGGCFGLAALATYWLARPKRWRSAISKSR